MNLISRNQSRRTVSRRHVSRVSRRTRALVVAALLVATLAACDPRETGSAAVVGGYRITETDVNSYAQTVIQDLQKTGAAQPQPNALFRTLISQLVEFRLIDVASEREGIHITQGQIDQLIDQSGGREQVTQQLLEQQNLWLPPELLDELARTVLAQQAIAMKLDPTGTTTSQSTALNAYRLELAKELGVQVSPRYGAWDASNLTLINGPNDLSTPAPGNAQSSS